MFTGTTDELNTVAGVVPGIVSSGSALIVNSVNDLTGVNIMTANGYYGSVLTASQPAITNVGTLLGLNVTGTLTTDTLTATNINGTIITASQPNITTIGSLTGLTLTGALKSQYTSSGNDGLDTGLLGRFKNNFIGGSAFLEMTNLAGTSCRIGCDGIGLLNPSDTAHVAIGNYTNGDLKLYTNAIEKMRIKSSGDIGINTITPNKKLSINSSTGDCMRLVYNNAVGTEAFYTDFTVNASGQFSITPSGTVVYIKSNVVIGNNPSGPNIIHFNGTTDDSGINVTTIAERIYGGTEQSELLIFKGTEFNNISGPDRIRLRAAEHRFQTYTTNEDFTAGIDNNNRLIIINSGLIGIGTTVPNKQLSINSITGNCLRIIFNNSSGTETVFSDITIDSVGNMNIIPTGTYIYTTKIYRIQSTSGDGFSQLSPNGLVELLTRATNTSTQIGTRTNTELNLITNNINRLVINSSGFIGIGTSVPNRQLSITNSAGNCLRLIYSNPNGTESIFTDFSVAADGNIIINPSGTYIKTVGKRIQIINDGYGYSHLSGTGVELVTYTSGNIYGFLGTFTTHPLYLGTDNTYRMVIDSAGLVGINTDTPLYRLQINTLINRYGMVHTNGTISVGSYIGGGTSNAQFGALSAHSLSLFANNATVSVILTTGGDFGINTLIPNKKLSVNSATGNCLRLIYNNSSGTEITYTDVTIESNGDLNIIPTGNYTNINSSLVIGKGGTGPNMLQFAGTTSDNKYTTVLMERAYADTTSSELLIFKGDDNNEGVDLDRIRFRSSEFRFQIIATSGEKADSQSIGTIVDNNNKLTIRSSGFIGINTANPNKQLTINSLDGNCLRLIYSNTTGNEIYYSDINVTAGGKLIFNSVGYESGFTFTGGLITGTLASGPQQNITQVGTLTSLTVTGTLTAGSFNTTNLGGIITTAAQPNITSLGPYLLLGTSTDSTRMISALKSTITNGTTLSFTLGRYNSTLNQGIFSYTHVLDGSALNYVSLGFTNQNILNVFGNNRIGINTLVPNKQLTINSADGQCLRLVYNVTTGSETTYSDYTISVAGAVTFTASGSSPSFSFVGGNINATLASGPQPNITSVGTLSNLTVTNNISASTVTSSTVSGTIVTPSQPNITSLGTLTNLTVSGTLVVGTFSAGAVASVIQTPGQPNITSLGTLTSLNMSGPITGATTITANLYNGTINTALQPNITSIGTLTSLNMSGPIVGVTTITASSISGTLTTTSQPNITSIGTLSSLRVTGKLSINTTSSVNQVNINSSTGQILRLIYNNNIGTESNYGEININSDGRLLFTTNGNSPGFSFTGGLIVGTIGTSNQPNITSLGTLTSLNVSGTISAGSMSVLSLGGTIATAAQPNITSLGILTSLTLSGAITGATSVTASTFIGTLTTPAQPNITSLGSLSSLSVNGKIIINTTSVASQLNINNSNGQCLRLIYNNSVGTETTYSDINISSTGVVTFAANGTSPGFIFSGGNIAATISTASQPNITSLGTLTSLSLSGSISGVTTLTATNITGTLLTAEQPNITSIGSLIGINLTGQIYSSYSTANGKLAFLQNTNIGIGGYIEVVNQIGTRALFGADGSALANGATSSVVLGNFSNGALKLFTNSLERVRILSTGFIGINTTVPNKTFTINGSGSGDILRLVHNNSLGTEVVYTDFATDGSGNIYIKPTGSYNYLQSHIVVGKDILGPNNIHFNGTTGDTGINNTVISERIYSGTDKSELLLFKGDDTLTGGPDRIRFRTAEIRFQTFTSNENFSGLNDNNNRLVIINSGLVGIGTDVPSKQLTINSASGQIARFIYNNSLGTETTYSDISLSVDGKLTFNAVGSSPEFIFTNGQITGVIKTAAQPNITSVGTLTSLTIAGALSAGSFTTSNLGGTLTTAAQPNITSVGTLNSLNVAGAISAGSFTVSELFATIKTASQPNITQLGTLASLNVSGALNAGSFNVGTLSTTNISGTLLTAAQPNITSVGTLTGLYVAGTLTADFFNIGNVTATLDTPEQPNITSFGILTVLNIAGITTSTNTTPTTSSTIGAVKLAGGLAISNTTDAIDSTNGGTFTSAGGGSFAKKLYVGTTLTATSLAGTIITAAQPNITSLGTLTSLNLSGSITGVTTISLTTLTATNLSGTLTTAAQPNITSVGTLTSLKTGTGAVGINTSLPDKQLEINSITGDCLRLTHNDATGNATYFTDLTVSSGGIFTIKPAGASVTLFTNKNLVLSGTGSISGVNTLTATSIDGTLTTAAQPNITSLGTLTSITTSGLINSTLNTISSNSTTGAVILAGGISISNSTNATSNTNGGTFTTAGGGAFAKSLYVGENLIVTGDLTINGITTTINSTVVEIADNSILLNNGPSGTNYDSGFIVKRYQTSNNSGSGDVVSGTSTTSFVIAASSSNTITLHVSASAVDNFYTNWWIKMSSGNANNRVRQIISYVGSTKVATLDSNFDVIPDIGSTVNLYNNVYTNFVWQESNKRFLTSYTASSPNSTSLSITNNADLAFEKGYALSTVASTSNSTGSLILVGGIGISNTTDATSSTNGGTFTSAGGGAFAKKLYVGTTLTATSLAGTIITAAQPNITSVGTLTSLILSGTLSGVTTLTATNIGGTLTTASQPNITSVGTLTSLTLSGAISGVTTLTATTLAGTLTTAAQTNITSVGTLTSLTLSGAISGVTTLTATTLTGTLTTAAQTNITSVGTLTSLTLSGAISGVTTLTATNIGGTLTTAAQPNITSVGTLTSLKTGLGAVGINTTTPAKQLEINSTTGDCLRLTYNDADGSALNYVDFIVASNGNLTITPSGFLTTFDKQFVIDHTSTEGFLVRKDGDTGDVFLVNTNSEFVNIVSHNGTTKGLQLGGTLITATAAELNILDGVTSTTAELNILDGVTATTAELNYVDVIAGIATASKALILDASKNIATINSLTATSLTGTLQTATQPNITSLGTLSGISTNGSVNIGTSGVSLLRILSSGSIMYLQSSIDTTAGSSSDLFIGNYLQSAVLSNRKIMFKASGSVGIGTYAPDKQLEINSATGDCLRLTYNDSDGSATVYSDFAVSSSGILTITPTGTSVTLAANKNLVLSGTGSISGVTTLTATNLSGTLTTAAQTNITSVGTLTSLKTGTGLVGINTSNPEKQLEINSSTGDCLRLTYNDNNGGASNYSDLIVSITGELTIAPTGAYVAFTKKLQIVNNGTVISFQSGTGVEYRVVTNGNLDAAVGTYSNHHYHLVSNSLIRLTVHTNSNIGIGTEVPNKKLSINDITGGAMRLIYNNNIGTETIYSDFSIASTGLISFVANGGTSPGFAFTGGNVAATLSTAAQPNITSLGTLTNLVLSGTISGATTITATSFAGTLTTAAQPNVTSLGTLTALTISNTGGTSLIINSTSSVSSSHIKYNTNGDDWEFGSYGSTNGISPNSMYWYNTNVKMILTNTAKLGINTTAPDKQLEINSATGDCLRLTYNDSNGSALTYCDFSVNINGTLTIAPTQSIISISGIIYSANGTVSAPTYTFSGDTNTGMYSGGTDILNFTTAGTDRLTILANGNVGIGNISPETTLHLTNSGYGQLKLETTSGAAGATMLFKKPTEPDFSMGIQTNRFYIYDATNYRFTINTIDENVGINTSVPNKALEVNSTTGQCLRLTYNDNNGSAINYSDLTVSSSGDLTIAPSGGDTIISGNLSATLTTAAQPNITSLGTLTSLSILETSGSSILNIESTYTPSSYTGVQFNTVGNDWQIGAYNANNSISPNSFFIYDNTSALSRVTINSSGNVGIGTTNPDKKLEINDVTGQCLRLTYNDLNGAATNYTDLTVSATGDYIITPSGGDTTIVGNLNVDTLTTPVLNVTGLSTNFSDGGLIINSFDQINMNGRLIKQELITDINLTDYNPTGQADNYSLEIIGYIKPQYTETYTFYITANDGARLWVNDQLIFNIWSGDPSDLASTTIALTAGVWYPIRIHAQELTLTQRLLLQWSSTSETKANIPSTRMAWDNTNNQVHTNPTHIADSLTLYNSTTTTANTADITVNSSGNLIIIPSSGNVTINNKIGLNGTISPIAAIDMGANASDRSLLLYKNTDIYGFGANNNLLKYQSGTSSGHAFYTNATTSSTGTELMRLLTNGNLGIGTTAPDKKLEINSSTGNCLRLTYNDSNGTATNYCDLSVSSLGNLVITSSSNYIDLLSRVNLNIAGSNIAFQVNGGASINTVLNVSTTSNAVGINTTSIDKALEINSTTGDCLRLTYNDSNGTAAFYSDFTINNVGSLTVNPSGGYSYFTSNLFVKNSSSAAFQIDNNGSNVLLRANTTNLTVGINTTAADKALEVNSATGACLRLTYNDNNGSAAFYSDFSVSAAGDLTITPSGGDVTISNNLGLNGTTSPIAAIDMGANSTDRSLLLFKGASIFGFGANGSLLKYQAGATSGHAFYTDATTSSTGTELMRLTTGGNLGIGTITPIESLDIYTGNIRLGDTNSYASDSYIYKHWSDVNNDHQIGMKFDYYTGSGGTATTHSRLNFISNAGLDQYIDGLNTVTMMTILSNGNVGIGATTPLMRLSLGATASDKILALFDATGWYGFGANASNLKYQSGGGHQFYTSSSDVALGTLAMTIDTSENLTLVGQCRGYSGSSTAPTFSFSSDTNTGMYSSGADLLQFTTAGSNRMWIEASQILTYSYFKATAGAELYTSASSRTQFNSADINGETHIIDFWNTYSGSTDKVVSSIVCNKGTNNNAGEILLKTNTATANTLTTRLKIDQNGAVTIGGSLSKGSGTFDIEHPLPNKKKEGYRLIHSFIEGPRCDLIYRGNIKLLNGIAIIDLNKQSMESDDCKMTDGTFEALCKNSDFYLQNKTGFDRVKGNLIDAILTITCENNNNNEDIISWMVIAERKDDYIQKWNKTNENGSLITEYKKEV